MAAGDGCSSTTDRDRFSGGEEGASGFGGTPSSTITEQCVPPYVSGSLTQRSDAPHGDYTFLSGGGRDRDLGREGAEPCLGPSYDPSSLPVSNLGYSQSAFDPIIRRDEGAETSHLPTSGTAAPAIPAQSPERTSPTRIDNSHIDKHLGPYNCKEPPCRGLAFASASCLNQHMAAKHMRSPRTFPCPFAGCSRGKDRPFTEMWGVKFHIARNHGGERIAPTSHEGGLPSKEMYRCPFVGCRSEPQLFSERRFVDHHVMRDHWEPTSARSMEEFYAGAERPETHVSPNEPRDLPGSG